MVAPDRSLRFWLAFLAERTRYPLFWFSGSGEGPTLTLWFCSEIEAPRGSSGSPSPFHVEISQRVHAARRGAA